MRLREVSRENDYIIAKGDTSEMHNVKFWIIRDYFAALEQILKDNDRLEKKQQKIKTGK